MTYATMEFQGMDTVVGVLHNISPRVTMALVDGMTEATDEAFALSQQQVPVRTGALKGSGYASDPIVSPGNVQLQIGYGGPAAPYALFVHENLSAVHPHGKAKYVEDPINTVIANLSGRMAGRVEGAILNQYPGSPARAQHSETAGDMRGAGTGRGRRAGAMSKSDVETALRDLAAGRLRQGVRAGGGRF